jgi:hypothetical protein
MNTSYTKTAWNKCNGTIPKFIEFITGKNPTNFIYCEARLVNNMTEKGDFSVSRLYAASNKLLLPVRYS